MQHIVNIYKPRGLTPGQLIQQFRIAYPQYTKSTIGYAGRLDPLAHGVMLLMIDEATKERDNYLNLPKMYEFEAVFGITTDTYDILGILQNKYSSSNPELAEGESRSSRQARTINFKDIQTFIHSKLGKQTQSYPPFSSKEVLGKPLFWWAKNNKLAEITIPQREIEIFEFHVIKTGSISASQLKKEIQERIALVQGDFRQKEIGKRWETFFKSLSPVIPAKAGIHSSKKRIIDSWLASRNDNPYFFPTARFKISCSSGTYVRSLVYELGRELDCGATTVEILRTNVGTYSLKETLILTQKIL